MIFSNWWCTLEFLHPLECCLVTALIAAWIQVPGGGLWFYPTWLWQEALTSSIILVQKSVAVAFIICNFNFFFHLSAWVALKERIPWNSHTFNLLPLYFLVQWIVYSIVHQLIRDGYCIAVHQPGRCEASLHCRYSHCSIHHKVLLLLFQLLLSLLTIILYLFWSVLGPEYLLSF